MPRLAYVNGHYVPHSDAAVSIDDRGYQFADGIYEVVAVVGGVIVDMPPHMSRLHSSLKSLDIKMPMSERALGLVMRQLIRRNKLSYGILYLQITRGVAPRDHAYAADLRPSMVMTCRSIPTRIAAGKVQGGISVRSFSEERWARPDIKSISLLPNILAKQAAREAGDFEAWFVDSEGQVTEGASTNAWMVTKDGSLITRPLSKAILPGVVRGIVFGLATELDLKIEERGFTLAEAFEAKEAFITSTGGVFPVVALDGTTIANGSPGDVTLRLVDAFNRHLAGQTTDPDATFAVLSSAV